MSILEFTEADARAMLFTNLLELLTVDEVAHRLIHDRGVQNWNDHRFGMLGMSPEVLEMRSLQIVGMVKAELNRRVPPTVTP